MQYIKIETAFDTDDKDYTKQKANFDEYYPLIANKEEFESIEYFWVIKEAKNVFESSLVLFASNSATGLINNKQAEQSLETNEPSEDTQTEKKSYYSHLLN